jgi:hypothetical protein
VSRAIRAFDRLLVDVRPDGVYGASNATAGAPWLPADELGKLRDPVAIADQLTRIRTGLDADPALAIGSAEELIESTAKTVLAEAGETWNERNDDLPALVTKGPKGSQTSPSSCRHWRSGRN